MLDGHNDDELVCPFCIADGSAAEFQEMTPFNSVEACDDKALSAEIQFRTPRLAAVQLYHWPTKAGVPMTYLGQKTLDELLEEPAMWEAALAAGQSWGTREEQEDIMRRGMVGNYWLHMFRSADGAALRAIVDG
ncbi:MAG: CbrC family protein [Terricaulis sp.]